MKCGIYRSHLHLHSFPSRSFGLYLGRLSHGHLNAPMKKWQEVLMSAHNFPSNSIRLFRFFCLPFSFSCMLIMGRCWCASVGAEKWDNMQNCCERFVTRAITPCFAVLHRKKLLARLSSRKTEAHPKRTQVAELHSLDWFVETRKKRTEKEVEDYVDAN